MIHGEIELMNALVGPYKLERLAVIGYPQYPTQPVEIVITHELGEERLTLSPTETNDLIVALQAALGLHG